MIIATDVNTIVAFITRSLVSPELSVRVRVNVIPLDLTRICADCFRIFVPKS